MHLRHTLLQSVGANMLFKLFVLGLAWAGVFADQNGDKSSVAIIGAGIGGSTAAYFLRQELGDSIEIHV